jgi:hypothetical protein
MKIGATYEYTYPAFPDSPEETIRFVSDRYDETTGLFWVRYIGAAGALEFFSDDSPIALGSTEVPFL